MVEGSHLLKRWLQVSRLEKGGNVVEGGGGSFSHWSHWRSSHVSHLSDVSYCFRQRGVVSLAEVSRLLTRVSDK